MTAEETTIRACPPPDPNPHAPRFKVPANACDTHLHVFGPETRYPYSPARGYTPPDATIEDLRRLHAILGIKRFVITQPSVYGTDNRATMDAVATAPDRTRAVIAVGQDISDAELAGFHAAGARGVRINLVDKGGMPFDDMTAVQRFAERIVPFGWHIEVLIHVSEFPDLKTTLKALPVDVVVGHLGYMKTSEGLDNPGFREFLDLLRDGKCWAKMTGTYRITQADAPPYDDVVPVARAILDAAPDRVIWGSDWPHPFHYRTMPNDGYLLDQLADWTSDEALIHKTLVENPETLYGF